MTWTDGDVRVEGATLHYYRRGAGRPVVLAHGVLDSGRCWNRVAEALEGDFELVAYDARYHGRSDVPESGDMSHGADDLVALIRVLGLERPFAIGHSMGAGTVASAVAGHPTLVRAAVLEDPPWREPLIDPSQVGSIAQLFAEMVAGRSVDDVIAIGRETNPDWDEQELEPWAESKLQFRGQEAVASLAACSPRTGRSPSRELRIPVLLVTGGNEARGRLVTPEVAAIAAELCPSLETVSFDEAGHNVRREAFDGYVDAVRSFLTTTDGAARRARARPRPPVAGRRRP